MSKRSNLLYDQRHTSENHFKRKKLAPGQLHKRGIERIAPALKEKIDYEIPTPNHSIRDIVNPSGGNPIATSTNRKFKLAHLVASPKDGLNLTEMLKRAFGSFVNFSMKNQDGTLIYKVESQGRKVLGKLSPKFGAQLYFLDNKVVAESVLRVGISITDRLSDFAEDFLFFEGDEEAFKKMLKNINSKRETKVAALSDSKSLDKEAYNEFHAMLKTSSREELLEECRHWQLFSPHIEKMQKPKLISVLLNAWENRYKVDAAKFDDFPTDQNVKPIKRRISLKSSSDEEEPVVRSKMWRGRQRETDDGYDMVEQWAIDKDINFSAHSVNGGKYTEIIFDAPAESDQTAYKLNLDFWDDGEWTSLSLMKPKP